MEEYETEEEFHQKKPYVEGWNLRLEVIMLCIHPGIWSNSADSPALSNDGYLLTIYKQARVWQQKLQQPFCLELQRMFQPQPPFAADFSLLPPRKDNPNHIIEIIPRSQALRQITWQSHSREIFYRYIQHEVTDSHHRCEFCHVWPVARHLTSFPVTFACGLCAFCSPCWPLYEMIPPDEREVTTQPGGQERELLQRIRQRRLQTLTPERIQDIKGLAARIKNVLDHTNQTAIFSLVPVLERTAYNEQIMAAYNASVHCLYGDGMK